MWPLSLTNAGSQKKIYLAVDVGTASVSAALAQGNGSGFFEVISLVRHPFNLLAPQVPDDREKRAGYIVSNTIHQTLREVRERARTIDVIRIAFTGIFFREFDSVRVFSRNNANEPITSAEIAANLTALKKDIPQSLLHGLAVVGESIVYAKINGYLIEDPVGYRGATLELSTRHLLISDILKKHIEDVKEKLFPRSVMVYYADERLLQEVVMRQGHELPLAVLDIGGEATSIFLLEEDGLLERGDPVLFGVRTLERRVAAFLNIDDVGAESVLRRLSADTLDSKQLKKIQAIIDQALVDWSDKVFARLKLFSRKPSRIAITGAGSDLAFFQKHVEAKYQHDPALAEPVATVRITIPQDVISPGRSFSAGGDTILGSLLIYAR